MLHSEEELNIIRKKIDKIDTSIIKLLSKRLRLAIKAKKIKEKLGKSIRDKEREKQVFTRVKL